MVKGTIMHTKRDGDGIAEVHISGEGGSLRIRVPVEGTNDPLTREQLRRAITEAKALSEAAAGFFEEHLRVAQ